MDNFKKLMQQAVRFGLVGVLNTLIDYAVYSLLLLIPFVREHYVIAQVIGYCAGLANSLYFNKKWTFAQKERVSKGQLVAFLAVNLAALGVSTAVLVAAQEWMGLGPYIGKIVATLFSMAVNFLGNKVMVFKK